MPRDVRAVRLAPPPMNSGVSVTLQTWFASFFDRVGSGPLMIQGYSRTDLPPAAQWANNTSPNYFSSLIYVINAGGATPMLAFSNGTDWLRADTGAPV